LKSYSKNSIYIILNLLYIIPGIICALLYINFFYSVFETFNLSGILGRILGNRIYEVSDLSRILGNIFGIIIILPYSLFYIMGLTFTILLHPLTQIIIFFFAWKFNNVSKLYIIIIFIISIIIAFIYLYLIWGKGYILTV
jgi:hypothetical protein